MTSYKTSSSISLRITRILCCVFLVHQWSYNRNGKTAITVDAAYFKFKETFTIPSCKDYGILSGAPLQEQCVKHCYPNEMEVYDYSDNEEDPDYVMRNTICRCFEDGESPSAPRRKTFECTSKAQVWEKRTPLMKCLEDFEIDSISTCQNYCKRIDPKAYSYKGLSGESDCSCGSVDVCSDKGKSDATTANGKTFASTMLTLSMGLLMIWW